MKRLLLLTLLAGCGPMPVFEQSRLPDPDGKVDLVLAERGTDATLATPTQLFLVPRGQKIDPALCPTSLLRADHFQEARIRWVGPREAEFQASHGRIFGRIQHTEVNGIVYTIRFAVPEEEPTFGR